MKSQITDLTTEGSGHFSTERLHEAVASSFLERTSLSEELALVEAERQSSLREKDDMARKLEMVRIVILILVSSGQRVCS